MSGVAIVNALLSADVALTAQVPSARILNGWLPLNSGAPAIGIAHVDGVEARTVSMREPKRRRTDRVQVTVLAKSYTAKTAVLELVRSALTTQSGPVAGVHLASILPDTEGPDDDDAASGLYSRSRDFLVTWRTNG